MAMAALYFSQTTNTIIGAAIIFCYLLYHAAFPRPISGIPYHKESIRSIWGDIPNLRRKDPSLSMFQWITAQSHELDSHIFQLFLFPFCAPKVFITDHREGLDIMLRRPKDFDRSSFFSDGFVGTVPDSHLVLPTSNKFKAQRKLLADTMTPSFLNKVAAKHIHEQSLRLVDLWNQKAKLSKGFAFDIGNDIVQMAFDNIWAIAFGTQINTIKKQHKALESMMNQAPETCGKDGTVKFQMIDTPKTLQAMDTIVRNMESASASPFPRVSHWLKRQGSGWKKAKAQKDKLVQNRIDDAEARLLMDPDDREDTVDCATDHMVFREQQAAIREDRAPQYDSPGAKDDLFLFLLAGHETTASAMKWAIKYITDHPSVQSKLRSSLYTAFETLPSGEEISKTNLPYLDAVIEEVLRHALPIGAQVRVSLRDTQVLGYNIPKGIDVVTLCNGPGFVLPDPFASRIKEADRSKTSQAKKGTVPDWSPVDIADFKPERWLKEDGYFDAQAGPSRQFGAGERGCFGRKLAYLELRMVIAIIVWSFELPRLPESLSSYKGVSRATREPAQCYARPIPLPVARA
ncbi:cytochrome P450 [Myriangium duriaei CBS 260.36]|uniref:Cytochrome P450 n=1 Tax=Myriangium duriaei CBS 260.36 TaxID=1168546 RepID=A0A9P4IYQ9_9PEZI|nr:cytochrome P450 [Myriangium duriaei CBS 260.36]